MPNNVIKVNNLSTYFYTNSGEVKAVDGVSFSVPNGKTLAIVGESGSGKSATALSIMRLIPKSSAKIASGEVLFGDVDLLKISEKEMINIRGQDIGMIFQEPMTSLNPVMKIGEQIMEVVMTHHQLNRQQARHKTIQLLNKLGITSPEKRINDYPHQMSGGMKQRVMIAIALICSPKLLIADEPTTSLDVTIQAIIIDLIMRLQKSLKMSIIFITHDLAVVAEIADYVLVMYNGSVVENANVISFFKRTKHPYSKVLLNSTTLLNTISSDKKAEKSNSNNSQRVNQHKHYFSNTVYESDVGCKFYNLCINANDKCKSISPDLQNDGSDHYVACWLYE